MSTKSRSMAGVLQARGLVAHVEQSPFAGEPANLYLRRNGDGNLIEVMRLLVRSGMTPRRAKEVIDALNRRGDAIAPVAHAPKDYARRFAEHGVAAAVPTVRRVNVKKIRERLGLSQREFAARFALDDANIKNWEQQRAGTPTAVNVLLNLIDRDPEAVTRILTSK
jgi:putative transcriptional regulator